MQLITTVELPLSQYEIKHSDTIMLMGSCFAENIGNKLSDNKFICDRNPFGILYNPMSIYEALSRISCNKLYDGTELMESGGQWFSIMHHGSFSSSVKEECLDNINSRISQGYDNLRKAKWLILTFGTARVYRWSSDGRIVGNCHKLSSRLFTRELLEVDDIVSSYISLIKTLKKLNPDLNVIFTVSPIRHAKDGMHGNQINKSVLLVAIDKICSVMDCCHYFPSYEIMMDELRDYRFYADDMFHPSQLAVEYIWEKFTEAYFSKSTLDIMKHCEEIRRGLNHRPFNPESESYRKFLSQILLKIDILKEKLPYLDVEKEKLLCQTLLKK